jgi:large subunit ribosomal protein L25
MLERFRVYTEEINQCTFQQKKAFKSWFTLQTHTVVIELGNGKSFNAIMQDIQVHPVSDKILHLDFFQIFDEKEITIEVPVKIVGNSKELWQVEIYV